MIGFEVPAELEAVRRRVAEFVQSEVLPVEPRVTEENFEEVLTELRKRAREAGLWTPHLPPEWGGMGLRALGMALVSQELGASGLASKARATPSLIGSGWLGRGSMRMSCGSKNARKR